MKNISVNSYFFLTGALLFLASSTRSLIINEVISEWLLCIYLIIGIYLSNKVKAAWITYYCFILVIFYNPFFLVFHNIQYSYVADMLIAVTFFFLALKWQSYSYEEMI